MADLSSLQSQLDASQSAYDEALNTTIQARTALDKANEELAVAQESGNEDSIAAAQSAQEAAQTAYDNAFENEQAAKDELDAAQSAYDYAANAGNSTVTNESSTDAKTAEQNANPSNTDSSKNTSAGFSLGGLLTNIGAGARSLFGGGNLNSMPGQVAPAGACFAYDATDLRVKLRVPADYLRGPAAGPGAGLNLLNSPLTNSFSPTSGVGIGALAQVGGIIFPYTPQISVANQANYQQNKVMHSNYPFYNYQNSSVGPISVTGKFTAQNEYEGAIILAIQHLLRALTKMKFGDDPDAGAPPPVCRLDAYGDYMLKNVPVAVSEWKLELPDQVDYIQVGKGITGYGNTMVPTSCTISLTLNVMYSRQEMMRFNVNSWLGGGLAGRGYL